MVSNPDTFLEILVEEKSMRTFLDGLLPRVLPESDFRINQNVFIRPHEGKSHLLQSIPKKLKAYQKEYRNSRLGIIVLLDQDSNDCFKLKADIQSRFQAEMLPRNWQYLIRIPCRELENWYLGDLPALERVIGGFKLQSHQQKAKFREPKLDSLNGYDEFYKLVTSSGKPHSTQKTEAARQMASVISTDGTNCSPSFRVFLNGLEDLTTQLSTR